MKQSEAYVAAESSGDLDYEKTPVWPVLMEVYQGQGYAAGFQRGISESLATALEATEDFLAVRGTPPDQTRLLLHAFIDFLEQRLRAHDVSREFVDGLGI